MIIMMSNQVETETLAQVSALLLRAGIHEPLNLIETSRGLACCLTSRHAHADCWGHLSTLPGIVDILSFPTPYQLASRRFQDAKSQITIGDPATSNVVTIGTGQPVIIAGPCAVETSQQLRTIAHAVQRAGATILRGGAFKPRSSPYSFQGLGLPGLKLLAEAREETGLPIITEVMEPGMVEPVAQVADVLQIGCRNMQNFPLLHAVGRAGKPV
jgi:3-deoxy-7-phosphoheptulonate synthase